jgi:TolB-like protein
MTSVWGELKRRNVVRVAIAYVIVSWLILQAADVLVPILGLPDWAGRLVFLFLFLGFFLALFFAWAYELTPDGVKREKEVVRSDSVTHVTGRKLDFIIIGVLAIALVFFAVDKFVLAPVTVHDNALVDALSEENVPQSIAVLPFVNMSSDPEQEYFSDGLSEELLNLLAKIPDLKVIARTSSFAFKGKNEDLRIIGEALGARTVLEGSVRKSGDRVRITAQLIDVSDGAHMWSDTYDRTITDVFAVQDEVAAAIIGALQMHVGAAPTRGQPTDNPEAYALFLKARIALNSFDAVNAEILLREAVTLDPSFAEAHEQLAYAYWTLAGSQLRAADGQQLMVQSATRALELNPNLALAQALHQAGNQERFDWMLEIEGLELAVQQQPNNSQALEALTFDLIESGYLGEALRLAERWVELDPLSGAAQARLSDTLFAVGREAEAQAAWDIAAEIDSDATAYGAANIDLIYGRDESAIERYELTLTKQGFGDVSWVRELITGARNPDSGQALLDRRIPEIVASMPPDSAYSARQSLLGWYLYFGYLDRFVEEVYELSDASLVWSDADNLIFAGIVYPESGFTAHPGFVAIAERNGLTRLWDRRSAPDFCDKRDGQWVCR